MPYIPEDARLAVAKHGAGTVGELTYAVTKLCVEFLPAQPAYSDFAEIVAALECAKLEFYWRSVRPYEDTKIAQNGDVY